MYTKLVLLSLLALPFIGHGPSRVELAQVTPQGAYQADIFVVCSFVGATSALTATETTVGGSNRAAKHHAGFVPQGHDLKLLSSPKAQVTFQSAPNAADCQVAANVYASTMLGSGWSASANADHPGHCWQAEGWSPCPSPPAPFMAQSFRVLLNGNAYGEYPIRIDQNYGQGIPSYKYLEKFFYVVVQPRP